MHCKKTIDARSYSHEALEQLRRDSVKRVEAGESPELVAAGLGINRRTIYRGLAASHYGAEDALAAQVFTCEYALWTLAIIRELIASKFCVKLSEVSVGRLMKRLGFSPQRPLYRAGEHNPQVVPNREKKDHP